MRLLRALFVGLAFMVGFLFTEFFAEGSVGPVRRDFDGDGYHEALVTYDGKLIKAVSLDTDDDGKPEVVIHYKGGLRERAVADMDHDGVSDTWVSYYFTGEPWKVARDRNGDGRPDYWEYLRQGILYKWEADRNFDGKADEQTVIATEGHRGGEGGKEFAKKWYDNDFDGRYDTLFVGVEARRAVAIGF
jgi:hypothetical protein